MSISNELSKKLSSQNLRKTSEKVIVEAPSSTANLGPGFDAFGLALDLFHDTVTIETSPKREISITVEGIDMKFVPEKPKSNTAGLVASIVMEKAQNSAGIRIFVKKGVPVGKGLGSSASSAAACTLALNKLFGLKLNPEELVELAAQGEVASAGAAHYDNVAAAALGGFVIVTHEPLAVARLKPPDDLELAIAIPKVELPKEKTKMMREILPKVVDFSNVTKNVSQASRFVAGIALSNIGMMGQSMVDSIVEPVRSRNIPMYLSVRKAAMGTGASGVAISGAGPTMLALCDRAKVKTKEVVKAMTEAFEEGGVTCEGYTARPSNGAKIVE